MTRERTSQGRKVVIKDWGEAKGLNNKISNIFQKIRESAFGNSADLGSTVLQKDTEPVASGSILKLLLKAKTNKQTTKTNTNSVLSNQAANKVCL